VDNCCMQLVSKPEQFDVMVCKFYPVFFNLWWSKQIGLQFILSGQLCCIRVLVKKTTTQSYYEPILVFPFFIFIDPGAQVITFLIFCQWLLLKYQLKMSHDRQDKEKQKSSC
jgi:hypothetical protein